MAESGFRRIPADTPRSVLGDPMSAAETKGRSAFHQELGSLGESFLSAAPGLGTGALAGTFTGGVKSLGALVRSAKSNPDLIPDLLQAGKGILLRAMGGLPAKVREDASQRFAELVTRMVPRMDPDYAANSLQQAARLATRDVRSQARVVPMSQARARLYSKIERAEAARRQELSEAGEAVPQNASPFNSAAVLARRVGAVTPADQAMVREYLERGPARLLSTDLRTRAGRETTQNLPSTSITDRPDVATELAERLARMRAEPAWDDPLLARLEAYLVAGKETGMRGAGLRSFAEQLQTMTPEKLAELGLARPISAQALRQRYVKAKAARTAQAETPPSPPPISGGAPEEWLTKTGEIEEVPRGFEGISTRALTPEASNLGSWVNALLNRYLRGYYGKQAFSDKPRSGADLPRQMGAKQNRGGDFDAPETLTRLGQAGYEPIFELVHVPGMPLLSPHANRSDPRPIMSIKGERWGQPDPIVEQATALGLSPQELAHARSLDAANRTMLERTGLTQRELDEFRRQAWDVYDR